MVMRLMAVALSLLVAFGATAQTVRYVHTDGLGSVVLTTDKNGNIIERSEYEPYGSLLSRPLKDGPGYTGHVMDVATGLTYMQQRYFDPSVARFLSVDPVAVDVSTAWNWARYNYAAGNPYKYKDPDGRVIKFEDGSPPEFLRNFANAVQYLNKNNLAGPIADAWKSEKTITLRAAPDRTDAKYTSVSKDGMTVTWADLGGISFPNASGNGRGYLSPALGLAHEFEHVSNRLYDEASFLRDSHTYDGQYQNQEERNVIEGYERPAAKILGEGDRNSHGGRIEKYTCPTKECHP